MTSRQEIARVNRRARLRRLRAAVCDESVIPAHEQVMNVHLTLRRVARARQALRQPRTQSIARRKAAA